jgi:hypothetical protein
VTFITEIASINRYQIRRRNHATATPDFSGNQRRIILLAASVLVQLGDAPDLPVPPGSVGVVITDGTNDGWSVQLIGVHETKAELLADGAFVFA